MDSSEKMKKLLYEIYEGFKLDFYNKLYDKSSANYLTASESFSLEVISSLENATVKQVAEFMGISQPNAAYKISNLEEKGYIIKEQSRTDRRTFYLRVTEKSDDYRRAKNQYMDKLFDNAKEELTKEEQDNLLDCLEMIVKIMPPIEK